MRQLFLHIGYPKTGTTSLQGFLAANAGALRAQGVLYPQTGRLGDAHYGVNFALDIADYARPAHVPKSTTLLHDLTAEADASNCARIVLSSEYFITASMPDRTRVHATFADYDVRIVCYLRRHDDALESAYAQAVKTVPDPPWEPNAESFVLHTLGLGSVSYDYLGVLRQWAARFGQSAVIVRPYERSRDIQADFLDLLGIADGPGFVRPRAANASIAPRTAAAIHLVRRTALSDAVKREMVGRLIAADGRNVPRAHFLSPAIRLSLVRRHQPMYRVIAREFLGRDGELFTAPLPDAADGWQSETAFAPEALVETILSAIQPSPQDSVA